MEPTPQASASFAANRLGYLWNEPPRRARYTVGSSRRSRETHYVCGVHTISPQATHTTVCLSSSEDRSDCELARVAPESRQSQ